MTNFSIYRKTTGTLKIPRKTSGDFDIIRKTTGTLKIDMPLIVGAPLFVSAEVGLIDAYTIDILFNKSLNESKIPDAADLIPTFSGGATQTYDRTTTGLHLYATTGVSSWYLPSINELIEMETALYDFSIGGLSSGYYNSSSEYNASMAILRTMGSHVNYNGFKNNGYKVRAIRTFTSKKVYSLRDSGPVGGWIFYITDNGDGSYTYLECASSDQASNQIWSNISLLIGTTGTAIGTGQANTTAIIGQAGHTSSAAKLCDDLVIGRAITAGETGTIQYVPNADNDKKLQGTNGAKVVAFTESVTNNVAATIPVLQSITCADGYNIVHTYDLALDETSTPATSAYSIPGHTVNAVVVSGLTVTVTVTERIYWGDSDTSAYTKPGTNMIKSTSGGEAASFTATAVTNNVALDSDASAFITASGLTDTTQKQAVDQLVQGLKADSIWTPMKAIYPMVGGTAGTHKWNLKDPRDLNVAFRLNFANSWVHAATGATPDGITAYADTFLVPNTVLTFGSNGLSFYSRTNTAKGYDIGASNDQNALTDEFILICKYTNNQAYVSADGNYNCTIANTDGMGMYSGGIADVAVQRLYKNGSEIKNANSAGSTLSTRTIYLCANHYGTTVAEFFGNKECAFAAIFTGLTPTQHANLNTRVVAYQTKLGRNV